MSNEQYISTFVQGKNGQTNAVLTRFSNASANPPLDIASTPVTFYNFKQINEAIDVWKAQGKVTGPFV